MAVAGGQAGMAEGVSFQIGDDQFKAILREALLASITTEARDRLLQEALTQVVTRTIEKGGYGQKDKEQPSLVERNFANMVGEVARETVRDLVTSDPEIRPLVEAMVRDVLLSLVSRDGVAVLVADALWAAVEQVKYR